MRPANAVTLELAERTGQWHLVRADYPDDALLHVRNRITRAGCSAWGECPNCHAQTVAVGTFDETVAKLADEDRDSQPSVVDFRMPEAYPRWREVISPAAPVRRLRRRNRTG